MALLDTWGEKICLQNPLPNPISFLCVFLIENKDKKMHLGCSGVKSGCVVCHIANTAT